MQSTAARISGTFASTFWQGLVLQASSHEPAVLHATLALAAIDKRCFLVSHPFPQSRQSLNDEERLILGQYNKAIRCVYPFFPKRDKASVRVLLIARMVFVCLEFLLGRPKAGYAHLSNGLRLLDEMATQDGGCEDRWLYEAFFTLNTHSALLQHSVPYHFVQRPPLSLSSPPPIPCESISQTRQHLDRLLSATHHLTAQHLHDAHTRPDIRPDTRPVADLLLCQRRICEELRVWKAGYDVLRARLFGAFAQVEQRDKKALRILSVHHTRASILSATCLRGDDESAFDHYTHCFGTLILQVVGFVELVSPQKVSQTPAYIDCSRYYFSADMGFIPPLFYTALKCRVLRTRMQAVHLLRLLGQHEGIWDAALAATVAEEVIHYEDERARNGFRIDTYDFSVRADPPQTAMSVHFRVQDVKIVLPDEPMGDVMVVCTRRQNNGLDEAFEMTLTYISGEGYVVVQRNRKP